MSSLIEKIDHQVTLMDRFGATPGINPGATKVLCQAATVLRMAKARIEQQDKLRADTLTVRDRYRMTVLQGLLADGNYGIADPNSRALMLEYADALVDEAMGSR